jgi:hypothetical protein
MTPTLALSRPLYDSDQRSLEASPQIGSSDSIRRRTASIFESRILNDSEEATTAQVDTTRYTSADATSLAPREDELEEIQEDFQKILKSANKKIEKAQGNPIAIEEIKNRYNLMVYEIISKVLSYDLLSPNEKIKIPAFVNGKFVAHNFEPIYINLVDGNGAYVFIPEARQEKDIAPILSFRGTVANHAFGTVRADLGIKAVSSNFLSTDIVPMIDVGRIVVEKEGKLIEDVLKEVDKEHGKLILMGHSLGGKLASSFAIDKENYKYVKELYTFHAPGLSKSELAKYESLGGEEKFSATSCTVKGDLAGNTIGGKRFFGKKYVIDPKKLPLSLIEKHTRCVISNNESEVTCLEADYRAMTTQRKIKRVLKFTLIFPIVFAITMRLGYILLALTVEAAYACNFKNRFKKSNESNKSYFYAACYAAACFSQITRRNKIFLKISLLQRLKSSANLYYRNRVQAGKAA